MQGWFVLDRDVEWSADEVAVRPESAAPLYQVVDDFSTALHDRRSVVAAR